MGWTNLFRGVKTCSLLFPENYSSQHSRMLLCSWASGTCRLSSAHTATSKSHIDHSCSWSITTDHPSRVSPISAWWLSVACVCTSLVDSTFSTTWDSIMDSIYRFPQYMLGPQHPVNCWHYDSLPTPIYTAGIRHRHSSGSPFCGSRLCYTLPRLWTLISVILWMPTRHLSSCGLSTFCHPAFFCKSWAVGHQALGFLVSLSPWRAKETEDCNKLLNACHASALRKFPLRPLPSSRNPCFILLLLLQISSIIPSFGFCSPCLCTLRSAFMDSSLNSLAQRWHQFSDGMLI